MDNFSTTPCKSHRHSQLLQIFQIFQYHRASQDLNLQLLLDIARDQLKAHFFATLQIVGQATVIRVWLEGGPCGVKAIEISNASPITGGMLVSLSVRAPEERHL